MKAWAVTTSAGEVILSSISETKRGSIKKWEDKFKGLHEGLFTWKYWKLRGLTCEKITITKY